MDGWDPRYNNRKGKMDPRLTRLWKDWGKWDPPPKRVKPIPLGILLEADRLARESGSPALLATARMMWVAYFFLCRPGEYCDTGLAESNHFFRLCDVCLRNASEVINLASASEATLRTASSATMTFTNQKNCDRGEKIGQHDNSHPIASPVKNLVEQVIHLRTHGAPPDTPLCAYSHDGDWFTVNPTMLTRLLRQATARVGAKYGLEPDDVSARSMRASGAMALLCAEVDPVKIQLMGRWRSDCMLRYLFVQADSIVRDFSTQMVACGDFSFLPNTPVHDLVTKEQDSSLYKDIVFFE